MQQNSEILIGFTNTLWGDAIKCFCEQYKTTIIAGVYPLTTVLQHFHPNPVLRQIAVLEVDCPSKQLITLIDSLSQLKWDVGIAVVSSTSPEMSVRELMNNKVSGLILKEYCTKNDFLSCLTQLVLNKSFLCSTATNKLLGEYQQTYKSNPSILTLKEKEVLHCMVKGVRNKMIAQQLSVSESTIKTHRKSIMKKLNSDHLFGVISRAFELRLLSPTQVPFCNYCEKKTEFTDNLMCCKN